MVEIHCVNTKLSSKMYIKSLITEFSRKISGYSSLHIEICQDNCNYFEAFNGFNRFCLHEIHVRRISLKCKLFSFK